MALANKVEELQRSTAILEERLNNCLKSHDEALRDLEKLVAEVAHLRLEFEREISLVKRDIDDLKKWREEQKKERDEWSRRLWAFGPNLLGALISGIIAAAVAYFISRR